MATHTMRTYSKEMLDELKDLYLKLILRTLC